MKFIVKGLDIHYGGPKVAAFNSSDADKMDLHPYDRVRIVYGDRQITAVVAVTKTFVKTGEIGLFREVLDFLGLKGGEEVEVYPIGILESSQLIRRKIRGEKLSKEQLFKIISDVVEGSLSEIEIAAFLLAQEFAGMSVEEIAALTEAMVETGSRLYFEEPVYDIHSIGGVPGNSKVALLEVPIVAAAGLLIPKTSSRAITSPAGTADTMEVLARVDLTLEEVKRIATKVKGTLVWGGHLNLAPADDIFIRVERPLGVDPKSQTVASILSKKVAMGVNYLVIDLPVGRGAKLRNLEEADKMARLFTEVGERLKLSIKCAITYGDQPIGYYIGPALEAYEALRALREGKGAMSLIEKAASLAGIVLEVAGLAERGKGSDLAKEIFYSGKAWEKMREIIEAQGGDPDISYEDIPIGDKRIEIRSPMDGYVTHVDNFSMSVIAKAAGAPKDKGAGIILYVKAGSKVKKGDKLFEIVAENTAKLTTAYNLVSKLHPVKLEGMLLKTFPE